MVQGLGVWGVGHGVRASGARGLRCRVYGVELRFQGSGFRVQGSGFRVQGSGFRVGGATIRGGRPTAPLSSVFWVSGLGFGSKI